MYLSLILFLKRFFGFVLNRKNITLFYKIAIILVITLIIIYLFYWYLLYFSLCLLKNIFNNREFIEDIINGLIGLGLILFACDKQTTEGSGNSSTSPIVISSDEEDENITKDKESSKPNKGKRKASEEEVYGQENKRNRTETRNPNKSEDLSDSEDGSTYTVLSSIKSGDEGEVLKKKLEIKEIEKSLPKISKDS